MPISLQSYPRNLLLAPTPLSSHPPAVSVLQQDTLPVVPSGPLPTATKATGNHHANSIVSMQDARRTEATSSKVLRPRGISKSSTKSLLDRLKHQVVQHADGNHPSIPIAASCRRELKGWPCCGHQNFTHVTHQYIRDNHPDIMCFVEPRISMATTDRALIALSFPNFFRVKANGFSGGIWLCWFDNIHIDILFSHFQFIHCRITSRVDIGTCLATSVYASPQFSKQKRLWDYLRTLSNHITEPWIALGNFNATLSSKERQGCRTRAGPDTQFVNVVFYIGLHDLGFQGPNFTWYKGNCVVHLDRVLCNNH
ncbi:hypothetical protein V6N13_057212 [Hibiscus sabdariffa]